MSLYTSIVKSIEFFATQENSEVSRHAFNEKLFSYVIKKFLDLRSVPNAIPEDFKELKEIFLNVKQLDPNKFAKLINEHISNTTSSAIDTNLANDKLFPFTFVDTNGEYHLSYDTELVRVVEGRLDWIMNIPASIVKEGSNYVKYAYENVYYSTNKALRFRDVVYDLTGEDINLADVIGIVNKIDLSIEEMYSYPFVFKGTNFTKGFDVLKEKPNTYFIEIGQRIGSVIVSKRNFVVTEKMYDMLIENIHMLSYEEPNFKEFDTEDYIREYHCSKEVLRYIPCKEHNNAKYPVSFGMELEFEVNDIRDDRYDRAKEVFETLHECVSEVNNLPYRYIGIERDGSLDCGFEVVTAWTGLSNHFKMLNKAKRDGVFTHLNSVNSSNAGVHIHVSKANMSAGHALKLVKFINNRHNLTYITRIAGRGSNTYNMICSNNIDHAKNRIYDNISKNDKGNPVFKDKYLEQINRNRYHCINFRNRDSIEFRLFKGTPNTDRIKMYLEFVNAAYYFTRDASARELKFGDFVTWLMDPKNRHPKKHLADYMYNNLSVFDNFTAIVKYGRKLKLKKAKKAAEDPYDNSHVTPSVGTNDSYSFLAS